MNTDQQKKMEEKRLGSGFKTVAGMGGAIEETLRNGMPPRFHRGIFNMGLCHECLVLVAVIVVGC